MYRKKQPEGSNILMLCSCCLEETLTPVTMNLWPPELPFTTGTTINTTEWMCHACTGNLVLPGRHWRKKFV